VNAEREMTAAKLLLEWVVFLAGMLLFASASWAASGWYLLIPPRSEYNERAEFLRGFQILDAKPLSQWFQASAYDSAAECEAAKRTFVMLEHSVYAKEIEAYLKAVGGGADAVVLRTQRYVSENGHANEEAYRASRCIRSDDPRLVR
jgi:hypothetical protein